MENKPLAEQVALVTGGSRGIGRSICRKLASLGATVVVNFASRSDAANELVAEIKSGGGNAVPMGFDVSNEDAVQSAFKEIKEQFERLDILVNNAGITSDSLLLRAKKEEWDRTIAVNLTGAFLCAKFASKPMMKARTGRIINISSVVGEMGNPGQAAYVASKAGLLGLTKSMAKELASRNITVNAVTPGFIQTDMTSELNEEQSQLMLANIPLERFGEPEDIAEAVAFLASPAARYITGQVLGVNGGLYM